MASRLSPDGSLLTRRQSPAAGQAYGGVAAADDAGLGEDEGAVHDGLVQLVGRPLQRRRNNGERWPVPSEDGRKEAASAAQDVARGRELLVLSALLLIVVLGASRLAGLTHQSLWYDEGYTATLAQAATFKEFWRQFGAFTMSEHLQPLYYFFMFGWSRVFGVSDAALRMPSVLFSTGAGVAACGAVLLLTKQRTLALLAALAVTCSSYSLYYAQEARPYALLQFLSFALMLTWLYARRWRAGVAKPGTRIALGVVSGLCLLGSPFTALLVLCVSLADLLVARRWRLWLTLWAPVLGMAAAMYLAYLLPALRTMPAFLAHDVIRIKQPLWMNVGYALYGVMFGTTLPPATVLLRGPGKLHAVRGAWMTVVPALLVMGMLVWTVTVQLRRAGQIDARVRTMLWGLVLYCVCLFGIFGGIGRLNVLPRHTSAWFSLVFVAVFCVAGLWPEGGERRRFALVFCGWLVLNGLSMYDYRNDALFAKDDYRATAAALQTRPGPHLMVAGMPLLLERYGTHVLDATAATPQTVAQTVAGMTGSAPEVTVVYNAYRNYRWDGAAMTLVEAMAPAYRCGLSGKTADIEMYSCLRR